MSNEHHHISSLVTDLVEMAQATKRLPELERELREAYQRIDQLVSRSQELERKIESEVAINTDLAAKLHAAEVARDDAGFRQLEAEDKAGTLLNVFENMLSSMGQTSAAVRGDGKDLILRINRAERMELEEYRHAKEQAAAKQMEEAQRAAEEAAKPVDPTPTTADTAEPHTSIPSQVYGTVDGNTSGERATDPTGESSGLTPLPSLEPSPSFSTASSTGVSVPSDPTVSQQISRSETVQDTTVPQQAGAPTQVMHPTLGIDTRERPEGKYANRRYADWPYYVSEAGWIEGGGTHESYWEGRAAWANDGRAKA